MFSLSGRARQAIKTALAMTIVYGIALGMGWQNPYWAGFAVAMISLSTVGQSLNKATMRILGTLVAATVTLTLVAWFAQDRWWYVAVLSLYLGFCVYMVTGKKLTYFWWCSAFVGLVIASHAAGDPADAFHIAVLRVQQTGMGILVYTLVSVLLWPSNTRGALDDVTRKLFATQARLYRTYRDLLNGHGAGEDSRSLRMQEVQLLSQHEQTLRGAQTDSYAVWPVRHQWWSFHRQAQALMTTLEQWRESFPEVQSLDRTRLLTNREVFYAELDRRFEDIERMLAGEAPLRPPQPVTLAIDEAAINALTHFDKAAMAVTRTELQRIETLSRSLFYCVADIKGYDPQVPRPLPADLRSGGFGLDVDRLQAAIRAMVTVWVAFAVWFYVNPPGHTSFVELTIIFVMASAMMRLDPATIVKPFLVGALLAGVLYIFVMPHLSGYAQLGAMIFGVTFAIYYLLWQPRQALAKPAVLIQFLSVIGIQNQQTYDFAAYANSSLSIALAGALAIVIWYLPPSPRPEKVFLRLLARFFEHSEHLMSRLALARDQKKSSIGGRWKTALYQADLLELPQKLALWGGRIDHRTFPDNSPEQVAALVTSLEAFALRIKALADTRDFPQADLLVRELRDDVRSWRLIVEQHLRLWADNPAMALGPSAELQDRLTARLARLETRVEEVFGLAGEGQLSAGDYENFYRLLGAYRGLSEAGIGYARLAEKINWGQWREARF